MSDVDGSHGQDLIDRGHAHLVMGLVGSMLRALHAVPLEAVDGLGGEGTVLVHGDYGPQNMLFDIGRSRVVALLDWEYARRGRPVEDLAWAEWIVRMHHRREVGSVQQLMDHSDLRASWTERHDAMVQRCHEFLLRSARTGSDQPATVWRERLAATERWRHE